MATRRDKSARKGKKRQAQKKVRQPAKKGVRTKVPASKETKKRAVAPKRKKARQKSGPKSSPKKRKGSTRKAKKTSSKKKLSKSVGRLKPLSKSFKKLRTIALKKKKLPLPTHPKRKGKMKLRGTRNKGRDILVKLPWENVREGWLEDSVIRAFESLERDFKMKPSMYCRFTFTVNRVITMLTAGSPKLIRATGKKVKAWFFNTGLAYSVENMRYQFEKGIDVLNLTIADARRDNQDPEFFLEYVTCIAYEVKP